MQLKKALLCLLCVLFVAGCRVAPIKQTSSISVDNNHLSEFFRLVDSYCVRSATSKEHLLNRLNSDKNLVATDGNGQTIFLSTKNGVTFGIFVEENGCAVDYLHSQSPGKLPFTYREFYQAIDSRGYKNVGGSILNGYNVARHFLSASKHNTLLFIPDLSDISDTYISLYVNSLNKVEPQEFSRKVVYVRGGLPENIRESISRSQNQKLVNSPTDVDLQTFESVANLMPDGRIHYQTEASLMSLLSQAFLRTCYDEKTTNIYLAVLEAYEKSVEKYSRIGFDVYSRIEHELALGFFASIAQALYKYGDYQKAVFYYKKALTSYKHNLAKKDPGSYVFFMEDYSAALYEAGEISQARQTYTKAQRVKNSIKTRSVKIKHYKRADLCHVDEQSIIQIQNNEGVQEFSLKNSNIVVKIELKERTFELHGIGGIFDITIESNQEQYQIIEASVSRVDSSLFEVVHPSLLGFKDKVIKPDKPLQIKDWKVKSSVVLGSLIGNGYTLTAVFTLRNSINQYRNISMVYEF